MALDYQGFATLGVNLNRQKYGPLDVSSVFTSTADLTYYRTKGQTKQAGLSDYWKSIVPYPYEGQLVSLVENGDVSVFKLIANGDVFDAVAIGGAADIDIDVDNALDSTSVNPVQNKVITAKIQDLNNRIDDLIDDIEYENISISLFSNNIGVVEVGSTVTNVIFNWSINKTPVSLMLDDITLSPSAVGDKPLGVTITKDSTKKSWTLKAIDEKGNVSTKTTYITFSNGIYYGTVNKKATINSALINNLVEQQQIAKRLQNTPDIKFTSNANSEQVFFYALPSSYKSPVFKDAETNLPAGMYLSGSIKFRNSSDYEEYYDIWLSEQSGLGNMTIVVSEVV